MNIFPRFLHEITHNSGFEFSSHDWCYDLLLILLWNCIKILTMILFHKIFCSIEEYKENGKYCFFFLSISVEYINTFRCIYTHTMYIMQTFKADAILCVLFEDMICLVICCKIL